MAIRTILALALAGGLIQTDLDARALSFAPVTRLIVWPRLPTDLEDFLYLIAVNFEAPQVCGRIRRSAEGGGGGLLSERGFQISSMRSDCYRNLAWNLHDPRLCDQAIAVRTAWLDGSKMDKAYCLNGVNGKGWGEYAVPRAMGPFVRYMRLLGYDDARVAADRWEENPYLTETHAAYERLRTDGTFIERLPTAPNVDRVQHEERCAVRGAAAHRDVPARQRPVRFT